MRARACARCRARTSTSCAGSAPRQSGSSATPPSCAWRSARRLESDDAGLVRATRRWSRSRRASTTPAGSRWTRCSSQARARWRQRHGDLDAEPPDRAPRVRATAATPSTSSSSRCTSSAPRSPSARMNPIPPRSACRSCRSISAPNSRRASHVDVRPDQHRRPRRARERATADERPRAVHLGSVGQRVPLRREGGLRAGRSGRGLEHLPHRLSAVELEGEPGDGRAHPGDVQRARAGDDADGGGGRPARRRRRRRRPPRHRALRVGRRHGRVHRDRHRDQAQGRQGPPRTERASVHARPHPARPSGR